MPIVVNYCHCQSTVKRRLTATPTTCVKKQDEVGCVSCPSIRHPWPGTWGTVQIIHPIHTSRMGNPLLESSVPFQGQSSLTEVCLNISARPAHPEKYNVATSRLPWKLKFGMYRASQKKLPLYVLLKVSETKEQNYKCFFSPENWDPYAYFEYKTNSVWYKGAEIFVKQNREVMKFSIKGPDPASQHP